MMIIINYNNDWESQIFFLFFFDGPIYSKIIIDISGLC